MFDLVDAFRAWIRRRDAGLCRYGRRRWRRAVRSSSAAGIRPQACGRLSPPARAACHSLPADVGRTGLARITLVVIGAALTWFVLDASSRRDLAVERRQLDARVLDLTARALVPGSALACLDASAGDTVEASCENALFATRRRSPPPYPMSPCARAARRPEQFCPPRRHELQSPH